MRKKLGLVVSLKVVIGFALLFTGCSKTLFEQDSCLFVQNSDKQRVSWGTNIPIELHVHESVTEHPQGEAFFEAIRSAVRTWNGIAPQGKTLFQVISKGISRSCSDRLNIIYLENPWVERCGKSKGRARERNKQGEASIFWRGEQILGTHVYLNGEDFEYFTSDTPEKNKVDFESLILHELGHVLGLVHHDDPDTVMYPFLAQGVKRRSFSAHVTSQCSDKSRESHDYDPFSVKKEKEDNSLDPSQQECQEETSERDLMMEFLSCEYS